MADKFAGFLVWVGGAALLLGQARAEEQVYDSPPPPEPGFQIVEEIRYKAEVCGKHVCPVQETKKFSKAVYDVKCVDFAQKKCPGCGYEHRCCSSCDGGGNPDCVQCGKVRTKKILLKKYVTEECPGTKCEVQCDYEQVPYKVYRKVPIGAQAAPPGGKQPEPLPPPIEDKKKEAKEPEKE